MTTRDTEHDLEHGAAPCEDAADDGLVLHTERLTLRRLHAGDALFILRLVNDPSFLQFIGDRGVRTADDARRYLQLGPMASYRQHGFGLFMTQLRGDATPVGICGLLKRPTLDDVDVGFAFLPEHCGHGYATEAASAVMAWGRSHHGLRKIVAITSPSNVASARVLEKIGLRRVGVTRLSGEDHDVVLFAPDEDA